jgi:hypothetical protein
MAVVRRLRKRLSTEAQAKWTTEVRAEVGDVIMEAVAAALLKCRHLHAENHSHEACFQVGWSTLISKRRRS